MIRIGHSQTRYRYRNQAALVSGASSVMLGGVLRIRWTSARDACILRGVSGMRCGAMRDSFMALVALIVTFVTLPIEMTLGLSVAALVYIGVEMFGEGEDWRQVVRVVERAPQGFYREALGGALDWIDRRLNPEAVERGDAATALSRAGGWRLYDRCLVLALVYPLVFVVGQWAVSDMGVPWRIGDFDVLPAEMSRWGRVGTVIALVVLTVYILCQKYVTARLQSVFESFGAGPSISEMLAFLVWLAVAVAGAVAGAIAGAIAIAFAFAGAFAVAGAVAFAVAGAFAFAGVFAFAFAGAGVGTVAVAFAVAVMVGFEHIHARRPVLACILLMILMAVAYTAVLIFGDFDDEFTRTLILFYGLLPLINAQFDFLSATATRHMLRRGLVGGQFWHGVWDALIGVILFAMLCFTATALAVGANRLSGETLVDLAAVFGRPQDHLWLFAAFLTTLLPTFLHGVLAVFSLALAWPGPLRRWYAEKIRAHHMAGASLGEARMAHLSIAMVAGGAVAVCVLVCRTLWFIAEDIGHLGTFLLHGCEGLARMLGGL